MTAQEIHIVTAYYPIRTKEEGRSQADYFGHICDLVDSFSNVKICLFVPRSCNSFIFRSKRNLRVVNLELDELPSYSVLREIFNGVQPIASKPIELRDWRYLTVQYAKFYLAHKYLVMQGSNSKLVKVLWLDAGIMRFLAKPDTRRFINYLEAEEFDLLCQLNIAPYYLNLFRSFERRLSLGVSVTCGSVIALSSYGAEICYMESMKYLNNVRSGMVSLHNEQIFLGYVITSVKLHKLIYLRRFSGKHVACINDLETSTDSMQGAWINGFTYPRHAFRVLKFLTTKTMRYLSRHVQ